MGHRHTCDGATAPDAIPGTLYSMEGSFDRNGRLSWRLHGGRGSRPGCGGRVVNAIGGRRRTATWSTSRSSSTSSSARSTGPRCGRWRPWSTSPTGSRACSPCTSSRAGRSNTDLLQQRFRWSTPVDIVTITIPDLLAVGIDPFRYEYPVDGYPDAAVVQRSAPTRLTDEFLTEIAHRYVVDRSWLRQGHRSAAQRVAADGRELDREGTTSEASSPPPRRAPSADTSDRHAELKFGRGWWGSSDGARRATRTPGPPARAPR